MRRFEAYVRDDYRAGLMRADRTGYRRRHGLPRLRCEGLGAGSRTVKPSASSAASPETMGNAGRLVRHGGRDLPVTPAGPPSCAVRENIAQAHQADEYIEVAELAAGDAIHGTVWWLNWRIECGPLRFAAGPALEIASSLQRESGNTLSKVIPENRSRTVTRRATRRPPARRVD